MRLSRPDPIIAGIRLRRLEKAERGKWDGWAEAALHHHVKPAGAESLDKDRLRPETTKSRRVDQRCGQGLPPFRLSRMPRSLLQWRRNCVGITHAVTTITPPLCRGQRLPLWIAKEPTDVRT
jgi:hypothetical protein